LPADRMGEFIATLPFAPDTFQLEAISALSENRSVLVAAPTGSGKTVVAEFAVHLALSRGLRAVYTTPIKALSNQKFRDFRARYGDRVGLMTGDLVENPTGRLLVMTTEVARNMLVQDTGSFQDVGALIFDEVHYLADPERGTAWEESILLAPPYVPLVCLSATVANASEIAEWIRTTGRDVALVESFERVVPLRQRYYLDGKLVPILNGSGSLHLAPHQKGGERAGRIRTIQGGWGTRRKRSAEDEAPNPPEVVKALTEADLLPAIYFLFSRKSVEEAAESCQRLHLLSGHQMAEVRRLAHERLAVLPAADAALAQVERLTGLLPKGVGFHHAGLLPPLKTLVEELLASGLLRVVFATDTLALGINVPARSVVVGEMTKYDGQSRRLLSSGEYRQLTGRAGRRGMDEVGYSVLLYSPWVSVDRSLEIADGDVAPLQSAFRPGYSTVLNLWRGPGDEEMLAQLIGGSLRQFQEDGRVRELGKERDHIAHTLASLPANCPVCGDFASWLGQEKRLKREQEKAEATVAAVRQEKAALEERLSSWPWQYTKTQRRTWMRAAEPGDVAYSRNRGWLIYLGPSNAGIGSFYSSSGISSPDGYTELSYLPDPPVKAALPESIARRLHLLDGAVHAAGEEERRALALALEQIELPDLETAAREAGAAARKANADALLRLRDRLADAIGRRREIALALSQNPYQSCPHRPEHRRAERDRRHYSGLLAASEQELEAAKKETGKRAQRTLRSIRSVLETFGYMADGQPTAKAKMLMRLFGTNSLAIAELLDWGVLADASPPELAEVASWFAFDKDGSGRALALTERLARIRSAAEAVAKRAVEVEHRSGLDLSQPLSPQFRGVALAWATGSDLSTLSSRSGLAEGDIVFALQKTIDICRQIGQAALHSRTPALARRAAEAEALLHRGVVASYYRWVVDGGNDGNSQVRTEAHKG
jgi:ATP-dependent RNA helicase HelY